VRACEEFEDNNFTLMFPRLCVPAHVGPAEQRTTVVAVSVWQCWLVFKCPAMASSCGRCRSVEAMYDCGWCPATRTCTVQSQCKADVENFGWLHRHQACPDPAVDFVWKHAAMLPIFKTIFSQFYSRTML